MFRFHWHKLSCFKLCSVSLSLESARLPRAMDDENDDRDTITAGQREARLL